MFKTSITKLPTLLLALLACFVTVSGPVRAIAITEESESEFADTLKAKEFCQQEQQFQKLRRKQVHHPLWRMTFVDEPQILLLPAALHLKPTSAWFYSSPPLRAPPA